MPPIRSAALALLLLLGHGTSPLWAETSNGTVLELQSPEQAVPLLELYTSEGCSSCPPADRYLAQLADLGTLWERVVPVAFHVTYWNYLGWRDRFSQTAFDQRQRALAAREGSGVYTPGVFKDGAEWRRWRAGAGPEAAQRQVGSLSAKVSCNQTTAWFQPQSGVVREGQPLFLEQAWLAARADSQVRAGENRGRTLTHGFVVLRHQRVPLAPSAAGDRTLFQARLASRCAGAQDAASAGAVALWVSDRDGRPLQATGGYWPALSAQTQASSGAAGR